MTDDFLFAQHVGLNSPDFIFAFWGSVAWVPLISFCFSGVQPHLGAPQGDIGSTWLIYDSPFWDDELLKPWSNKVMCENLWGDCMMEHAYGHHCIPACRMMLWFLKPWLVWVFVMRSIGILITWNDIWVVRSTSFPWVTQHVCWGSDDRRRYNHVWYTDIQLELTGFGLTNYTILYLYFSFWLIIPVWYIYHIYIVVYLFIIIL